MPKDYKDTPSPRGGGGNRLNHPVLLGLIIGLLLGIVISLAVALWLNRLNNPFVAKGQPPQPVPKIAATQPPPPPEAAEKAAKAAKGAAADKNGKAGERPRFEFYNILPGDKEAVPREAAPPAKTASAPPTAPRPGSSPATPKPHTGETYWLQAGAFADEKEADNLRAKIALTGLEASVRAVAVPDKGKLYRVRLGPYQSLDDANRIKATLSQNGVGAAIIRTTDENRNP